MPIVTPGEALNKVYDYIIVGAGASGLTLATRLSEEAHRSVLVIEAGANHGADPRVKLPGKYSVDFEDERYGWNYTTDPQENAHNRRLPWFSGKGLGGTSNIDYYVWSRPPAADADDIERLGNPSWNNSDCLRYVKASEKFHPPTPDQLAANPQMTYNSANRGHSGPVQVTLPNNSYAMENMVRDTLIKIPGVSLVNDPTGGEVVGTSIGSATIDPRTWTRSSAVSAYLAPNISRENLTVLTDCLVSRIDFNDRTEGETISASGVEFIFDDETYVAQGSNIILCAGTVKSPHILELSGIGNSAILSSVGLTTLIDLPGVGENVQDHAYTTVLYELQPDTPFETFDCLNDPEYANGAKSVHSMIDRMAPTTFTYLPLSVANPRKLPDIIRKAEEEINTMKKASVVPPGLAEQYDIQLEKLRNTTIPEFHVVPFPGVYPQSDIHNTWSGKRYLTMLGCVEHPFSRGQIHASSSDPKAQPLINPNCLKSATDRELILQNLKFIRKLSSLEPFKSSIAREVSPGDECVTDDQMTDYIKENVAPGWQSIGSCSMLPRDKNGVVNPDLKVYGTSNLYVADLSVIPLHFASYTSSISYAIAEKAADILKRLEAEA